MTTFVGLDLARTLYRETGICRFEGDVPGTRRCIRLDPTGPPRIDSRRTG